MLTMPIISLPDLHGYCFACTVYMHVHADAEVKSERQGEGKLEGNWKILDALSSAIVEVQLLYDISKALSTP